MYANKIAEEVLIDLASKSLGPTAQSIGHVVNGIFLSIFTPMVKYGVTKQSEIEAFTNSTKEKFNAISDDKIIEPPLYIIGSALESSKYCIGIEELRELFSSLITSCMNEDLVKYVHPSFVEIIKQMSPIEANIFKILNESNSLPIGNITFREIKKTKNYGLLSGAVGSNIIHNYILLKDIDYDPDVIQTSIENLVRLKLVDTSYTKSFTDKSVYKKLEESDFFQQLKEDYRNQYNIPEFQNYNFELEPGILSITSFGRSFAKSCLT